MPFYFGSGSWSALHNTRLALLLTPYASSGDQGDGHFSFWVVLGIGDPDGGLSLGTMLLSPCRSDRDYAKTVPLCWSIFVYINRPTIH